MRLINYQDCIKYIQHKLGIKLYDYQKDMLEAMCDGVEFRSARGIGRTFVAECFGKYIAYLYSKNDYNEVPSVVFPYTVAIRTGLIVEPAIEKIKTHSPEVFEREYECKCK